MFKIKYVICLSAEDLIVKKFTIYDAFDLKSVFDINNVSYLMYERLGSQANAKKPRYVIKFSITIKSGITIYIKSRNIGD